MRNLVVASALAIVVAAAAAETVTLTHTVRDRAVVKRQ